jgi:hypothetical protein
MGVPLSLHRAWLRSLASVTLDTFGGLPGRAGRR